MDKRTFLKTASMLTLAAVANPLQAIQNPSPTAESQNFQLPDLGFPYNGLEPFIDAKTMEIHHGKHHATYVNNLNNALKDSDLKNKSLIEILKEVGAEQTAIRNNAGGHYNHELFWKILKPGGPKLPKVKLLKAINLEFGSFDGFKSVFSDQAKKVFGSGWTWLTTHKGKLAIVSTPNQDNPLMSQIVSHFGKPVLGIDVWEHAYYLKYQNRRNDYIEAFFQLINWQVAEENYKANS